MGLFGSRKQEPERSTEFDHEYVTLRDPGLPAGEIKQVLYEVMRDLGLLGLIFGPGPIGSCFETLADVAPVFRSTQSENGLIGDFPDEQDLFWYALRGTRGSAIVINFGPTSDDLFRQHSIDGPLSRHPLRDPFTWGTVLGRGASVPAPFADIFADAVLHPLNTLPGLSHLSAPPPKSSPDEPRVTLPVPPPGHPMERAYRVLTEASQCILVYGPGDLANLYTKVLTVAPDFAATTSTGDGGWIGRLPSPGVRWFGVEGTSGAGLVITVESRDAVPFVSTCIMPQIGSLQPEFTCEIAENGSVPGSFARLFTVAVQRPLSVLPGLAHLVQG
ncbi:hypothetical protein [Nocardia jiangsuensis]|uniref:Uncharacterized protein n=1 Tax=Nocardia jiangsuensis TaxID=1691563 RepID=A0ABV8E053_9NOCA